ncbi:hypothetical protein LIZ53_16785, partial [Lachnoclostridium sp. 210928-DFI.6.3]|nr:hypothetical protein [Lachnoclostridium sp. 210928-DFI.6.3]
LVQFSKVFASLGDNYLSISSTTSPVNYFFEIFLAFFKINVLNLSLIYNQKAGQWSSFSKTHYFTSSKPRSPSSRR